MNKAIILCGGNGKRLSPATKTLNKSLLPILNRPMVEYPLETIKQFGINDVLLISGGNHIGGFCDYLKDGSEFGLDLTYKVQKDASGIAHALGLAKDFVGDENFLVLLGDNFFEPNKLFCSDALNRPTIFLKEVSDPERFGVLNENENCIVEKPKQPVGNLAVTGLYIYDHNVFDFIETLKPSARGELEITDVNNWYLQNNNLEFVTLNTFWHDMGTVESKFETEQYVYCNPGMFF